MSACPACGGLILLPNVAYGYAGPVCHCQPVLHVRSGFYDQMEMVYKPELEKLRKGHARYEYLRTLNVRQFSELFDAALKRPFDDLVDDGIVCREIERADAWHMERLATGTEPTSGAAAK